MNPEVLLGLMDREKVLAKETFRGLAIDAALEARDASPFDREWMRVFRLLESHAIEAESGSAVERIRERAFKLCFAATENPELSGYVSDDFDLLARALSVGVEDEWLTSLFSEYLEGRFPTGTLRRSPRSMADLVRRQEPDV